MHKTPSRKFIRATIHTAPTKSIHIRIPTLLPLKQEKMDPRLSRNSWGRYVKERGREVSGGVLVAHMEIKKGWLCEVTNKHR